MDLTKYIQNVLNDVILHGTVQTKWGWNPDALEIPKSSISDLVTGNWEKDDKTGLYIPPIFYSDYTNFSNLTFPTISNCISYKFVYTNIQGLGSYEEPKPDSEEFKTNSVEVLNGWRQWKIENGFLRSINDEHMWLPDVIMEAHCDRKHEHPVPAEFCACGIYAKVEKEIYDEEDDDLIFGEINGWGRYVLGEEAWRVQYAYPRSFHLKQPQVTPDIMEVLQKYHVPIYVDQPMMIYNPKEDGYEYRNDEENRNFGSNSNSDAGESAGEDSEAN